MCGKRSRLSRAGMLTSQALKQKFIQFPFLLYQINPILKKQAPEICTFLLNLTTIFVSILRFCEFWVEIWSEMVYNIICVIIVHKGVLRIMTSPISKEELLKQLKAILEYDYQTTLKDATVTQLYRGLSTIVVNYMKEKRHKFMHDCNSKGRKQVYYLSMEFLMGRSLKTSL